MLRYIPEDTSVVFREIPDQICLAINISGCPHRCPGCHSPYLRENLGEYLTTDIISSLIKRNYGITCILFMGGDADKEYLKRLALYTRYLGLLVAWYSGEDSLDLNYYRNWFDYIKVGSYKKDLGPLSSKTTNQRLYKINNRDILEDITYRFW